MADTVSAEVRSQIMSKVPRRDTSPERWVRSLLHRAGFRFRLHDRRLPGTPDIVLPRYRTAIYIHGCFWHQHPNCPKSRRPTSNSKYWDQKLDGNISRDKRKASELSKLGWRVITLWQCEIQSKGAESAALARLIADLKKQRAKKCKTGFR